MKEDIQSFNIFFEKKSSEELIDFFLKKYRGKIALASSLGLEDQVLTDMILKIDQSAPIFSIDTGRLFPETYSLISTTNYMYNIKLKLFSPQKTLIEDYIKKYGVNGFYESLNKRKECCKVRKIEPLLRALSKLEVWICGLRKEQSATRKKIKKVEWDEFNHLIKLNPLADWGKKQVWDYVSINKVPYNKLHEVGFSSIGCLPCTRPIKDGETSRAGRWWWEKSNEYKECGLHQR